MRSPEKPGRERVRAVGDAAGTEWAVDRRGVLPAASPPAGWGGFQNFCGAGRCRVCQGPLSRTGTVASDPGWDPAAGRGCGGGRVTPAQVGDARRGLGPAGWAGGCWRGSQGHSASFINSWAKPLHRWEQGARLSSLGWTEGGCICMLICMLICMWSSGGQMPRSPGLPFCTSLPPGPQLLSPTLGGVWGRRVGQAAWGRM